MKQSFPSFPPHFPLKYTTWDLDRMPVLFIVSGFLSCVTTVLQQQPVLDLLSAKEYTEHSALFGFQTRLTPCFMHTSINTVSSTCAVTPLHTIPQAIHTQFRTFLRSSHPFILVRKCIMGSFPFLLLGYFWLE